MSLVIGLLGGVASGKSTVARLMARRGLLHVDADALAREVVEQPSVRAALADRFGGDLFDEHGTLDRGLLADRAFSSQSATQELNSLIHPAVRERIIETLQSHADQPVVLDVPLLLDSPLAPLVTHWVFLETEAATRDARAVDRNWSPEERARRESRQSSLAQKRSAAQHVLENNGKIEDLEQRVDALLQEFGVPI